MIYFVTNTLGSDFSLYIGEVDISKYFPSKKNKLTNREINKQTNNYMNK